MSAWPIYGVVALYVAVSPLLNTVIAEAGLLAPVVTLAGGGLFLLLAFLMKRWGSGKGLLTLTIVGLLVFFLVITTRVTDRVLYHGNASTYLSILLALFAAAGLAVRSPALRYAGRFFFAAGVILYVAVMLIGVRRWNASALLPVLPLTGGRFLWLSLRAALAFLPLTLPLISEKEMRFRPLILSVAGVTGAVTVGLFAYPSHMLTADSALFIEVARNLSFGRFFQRMEFPGVLLFLLLSLHMILYAASQLRTLVASQTGRKETRRLMTACLTLLAALSAILAAGADATSTAALWTAGAAFLLSILWSALCSSRRRRIAALLLALAFLPLSSCIKYREIDTYEYPLIVAVAEAGEECRYLFRSESSCVEVTAPSLLVAKEIANRKRAKPLNFSQLGMAILPASRPDLIVERIEEIVGGDVDNAVILAVTDDDTDALKAMTFSDFHGISEFFDEFKSHMERHDFVDRTAFEALTSYRKYGTLMITSVTLGKDAITFDGAVIYGEGSRLSINIDQLDGFDRKEDQYPSILSKY